MKHNQFFDTPMVQKEQNNNPTSRKNVVAMLLLMAFISLGGQAWGQNTHWTGQVDYTWGAQDQAAFLHYASGTTITIEGNVTLSSPLLVLANESITIITNGNGPHTITYTGLFVSSFSPFMNGYTNANGGTLTINGGTDGIVINGNTSSNTTYVPCITINSGGTCTLTNVTIQNNKATNGGAILNNGTLTATSCTFQNNTATNLGGAINSSNKTTLTSCTITGNTATGGAGIYASEVLSCTSCTLSNNSISNSSGSGGGIYYCGSAGTTNKLTIDGCTINGNYAAYRGGGIIMHVNGTTYCNGEIKGATEIYDNSAKDAGGLALHNSGVACTLSAGSIYGNSASRNGGGVHISASSTLTYSGGDIGKTGSGNENTASDGGGVYIEGTLTMTAGNILNNSASSNGGGVYVTSTGSLTFTSGSIHNNSATANGGGIYFNSATTLSFGSGNAARSIYSNSAAKGGGVYVDSSGTFKASNANMSIYSNSATYGGGIYSKGDLTLSNSPVGKSGGANTASSDGGGVYIESGTLALSAGSIGYNTASGNGGGVYIAGGTSSTISGGTISCNTATGNGGGMYIAGGTNNTISGGTIGGSGVANTAANGGGVYIAGGTNSINGGSITYNTATSNGGGVYVNGGGTTMASGSGTITYNSAVNGGGVFVHSGTFTMATANATINNNTVSGNGGGAYVDGGTLAVNNGTIYKHTAINGGGVYVDANGTLALGGGTIGKASNLNTATYGGGVYTKGTFNFTSGNITSNSCTTGSNGAGVYIAGGTTTMSGGSINTNTGAANGGGVYLNSGTFKLSGTSTIYTHSATYGGGVYNNGGTFQMEGGEIYKNTASANGGGVYVNGGTNTISGGTIGKASNANTAERGAGVYTAGTLNIQGGNIQYNTMTGTAKLGAGVYIDGGTTIMSGGSINNNTTAINGGGAYVNGGTFTINNGSTIANNAATSATLGQGGGGIYIAAGSTTMYGGDIYGNTATTTNGSGGGVCVAATFDMQGGTIGSSSANNQAKNGGGVCVSTGGTFTMSGGEIHDNKATQTTIAYGGGGVYVQTGGTFTMSNTAKIYSNIANSTAGSGGGVCLFGTFNWYGGTIYNNTSINGGGLYLGVNFTMPAGRSLYSNTATSGGGIYVPAGITFTMSGGEIYSNTATSGGGVYINATSATVYGVFNMTGGYIGKYDGSSYLENKATNGGGVYVVANGRFTMENGNIFGNKATTNGGGIYTLGTVTATNGVNKVYNNQATNSTGTQNGGGVFIGTSGVFSMTNGEIYNNTARSNGGGVYIDNNANASLTLNNTLVYGNSTTATAGAGIYKSANAKLSITGGEIYGNQAATNGGGIFINGGTGASATTLSGVSIGKEENNAYLPNTAKIGGGIYITTGTVTIQKNSTKNDIKSYIIGNNTIASGSTGGGIYMAAGTLNISDTEISNNTATTTGGGIHHGNGTINIIDSEITGNSAATNGGGIYKVGNNTTATNIYVSGVVVINNNLKGTDANNLYIANANTKFIYIASAGLECGSCIGITSAVGYSSNTKKIVQGDGTGTVPTDNCAYAYRNRFFFSDNGADGVFNNNASPYYSGSTNSLYFVANATYQGVMNSWLTSANATGCTLDGNGFVTAVNNAAGMAYFAQHILAGNDYSGKTVSLTANIDLSGHNWEPIGYAAECLEGNGTIFNGTFDGQGHTIANITSPFPYDNMGLFGAVGDDGVVKNTVVANIKFSGSNTHTGAVAGLLNGSAYNCSAITLRSGSTTTAASLVGELGADGSLMNCFVNTSATNGLADVNGGTIANCYMRGATSFVGGGTGDVDYCYAPSGSASGTNSVYGATTLVNGKYGFAHSDQQITANSDNSYITNGAIDNRGELKGLLATLNNWVRASGNGWNAGTQSNNNGYALWTRTMASPINGDYPVLMMPSTVCVGSPNGTLLDYASDVNTLMTSYTTSGDIYLYATNPTALGGTSGTTRVYINEHVGVLQAANTTVNARVGVTLDNSSSGYMSYDWHMFSSALTAANMGLVYHSGVGDTYYVKDNYSTLLSGGIPHSVYTSVANMDPTQTTWSTSNIGYFPTNTPYGKWRGTDDPNGCFDFYCYAEPYCHWINFKREGTPSFYDHWREPEDANHMHQNIPYENELTMTQGKGYLVDLSAPSMLMSDGTLNNGNISVSVTATNINYTGYEYALKGVNLIGNPYQSYLDFDEFAANSNNTDIGNTYFILDADHHGYVSYTVGQSAPIAPQFLHPHQGFFVRVSSSRNLQFTPSMCETSGGNFRDDRPSYPLVNLICSDSQGRNDFATVELDRPDAGGGEKVSGLHAGDASIWFHLDDLEWQTAFTLPGLHEAPVRFRAYNDGTFTLGWEVRNADFSYLHLIDNLTGMNIDCLSASEYVFEGKTTDYWSRFRLVFEYTDVDENDDTTGPGSFAFMMGDELVVNCDPSTASGTALLQLFDLNGRCLYAKELYDTQNIVSPPKVAPGIYILRLTSKQGTKTQKMVINQ